MMTINKIISKLLRISAIAILLMTATNYYLLSTLPSLLRHDWQCTGGRGGVDDGTNTHKCQDLLGSNGTWIQDWDFAKKYGQYSSPIAYPLGPHGQRTVGRFRPSTDAPYPWPTSWKWQDSNANCQINVMTHEGICDDLIRLGVRRILFYGDSLTQGMYESFMNLIGHVRIDGVGYSGSFICESNNDNETVHDDNDTDAVLSDTIIHVLHKRDNGGMAFPNSPRGVYNIDNKTQRFINMSIDRAIGVFNIGAHYHNFTHYQEDMDIMLQSLSNLARSQDLYFFRSTSPGHHDCCCNKRFNWTLGTRITPLKSYSEYSIPHDHKYDWDKFEHYNAYTQLHLLHASKNFDVLVSRAPVFFLNIFNMTVLRHDGHGPGDCLHYLSAVTDWWNHLLFTYLQELSRVETSSWSNCQMN